MRAKFQLPFAAKQDTTEEDREPLLSSLRSATERGRRLAIYDPSSGLLSPWYFELRLDEECHRAQRYNMSMTILAFEQVEQPVPLPRHGDSMRLEDEAAATLKANLRSVDLVASHGFSGYRVALLQCNYEESKAIVARIMGELRSSQWNVGVASLPEDALNGKALLQVAVERAGGSTSSSSGDSEPISAQS